MPKISRTRRPFRLRRAPAPAPTTPPPMLEQPLNLPLIPQLQNAQRILIAGAGGGFDVFAGLPLYFTLREQGKQVHLANYSFTPLQLAGKVDAHSEVVIPELLLGTYGNLIINLSYFPEGFLARWFREVRDEKVPVWMLAQTGVVPLARAYSALVERLGGIDLILLIDGGVDSLMHGDETHPGSMFEDSASLAAVMQVAEVPHKLLVSLGFGTEAEEMLCHVSALENMAQLAAQGAFYGGCTLTAQMPAFKLYEAACRYVWEQPDHSHSHISTRIIPAVHGKHGNYSLYPQDRSDGVFISLLMAQYWFFDAYTVAQHNQIVPLIGETLLHEDVRRIGMHYWQTRKQRRPRRTLPY